MTSTAQLRHLWAPWKCDTSRMVRYPFPGDGRVWNLYVADVSVPAWDAFTQIMRDHDYLFLEAAGGTYNCRNIASSGLPSLHSYGIALDLNPSKNPFGTNKNNFPPGFLSAISNIRIGGRRAFTWGGGFTIPDPMHFQLDIGPNAFNQPQPPKPPDPPEDLMLTDDDIKRIHDKIWFTPDSGGITAKQYLAKTKTNTDLILKDLTDDDITQLVEAIETLPAQTVAAIRDALNKGTIQ